MLTISSLQSGWRGLPKGMLTERVGVSASALIGCCGVKVVLLHRTIALFVIGDLKVSGEGL